MKQLNKKERKKGDERKRKNRRMICVKWDEEEIFQRCVSQKISETSEYGGKAGNGPFYNDTMLVAQTRSAITGRKRFVVPWFFIVLAAGGFVFFLAKKFKRRNRRRPGESILHYHRDFLNIFHYLTFNHANVERDAENGVTENGKEVMCVFLHSFRGRIRDVERTHAICARVCFYNNAESSPPPGPGGKPYTKATKVLTMAQAQAPAKGVYRQLKTHMWVTTASGTELLKLYEAIASENPELHVLLIGDDRLNFRFFGPEGRYNSQMEWFCSQISEKYGKERVLLRIYRDSRKASGGFYQKVAEDDERMVSKNTSYHRSGDN